jgi:hypothetical protein
MATRTTRKAPRQEVPAIQLSMFGKRWQASDWLIPIYLWIVIMTIAAVTNRLQAAGTLPAGGTGFVMGYAGITVLGMLCGLMLGGSAGMSGRVTLWCLGVPLAGGAWTIYTSLVGMTSGLAPWVAFLVLCVLTTVSYRSVRDFQRAFELELIYAQEEPAEAELVRQLSEQLAEAQSQPVDADKEKWEEWTDAARLPDMIFHGRHPLKNGSGFLLHYELPDNGSVTYEMVEQATGRLELQLMKKFKHLFEDGCVPPGCVRVQRATGANKRPIVGEVFIAVDVVDILAKTLRLPTTDEDYTELSIMEAFQVGEFSDGTPIYLTIHEIHTLIIGQTQNGKSNLLHVMIRQLARCTDAVLWGLDFKGGDTIRLWMNPYMTGEIDPNTGEPLAQCIFDWVAVNDHIEAERMLMALLEAANQRPAIVGGGGWVPSKARPAIVFIADEISEIVGSAGTRGGRSAFHVGTDYLAGLLARVFKLGTGQGVYGVTASQRGTVDSTGGGTAKSQQKGRILLPVTTGASDVLEGSGPEARRLASNLIHKGSVVIEGFGYAIAKQGKIWLAGYKPEIQERIRHEVLRLTYLRRDVRLDPETAAFLEKFGYAGRPGGPAMDPDRIAWYFGKQPKRQLLTWDYEYMPGSDDPVKVGSTAAAAAGQPSGGSSAELLGLSSVRSPLAPAAPPRPPVSAENVTSLVGRQRGGVDPAWEARQRELLAELGDDAVPQPPAAPQPQEAAEVLAPPPVPEPEPAPTGPEVLVPRGHAPSFENSTLLLIRLIHDAGSSGINGADLFRQLTELGHAPNRSALYPWLTRLVEVTARNGDPTKKVIQEGKIFMTQANKPMPTRMAS